MDIKHNLQVTRLQPCSFACDRIQHATSFPPGYHLIISLTSEYLAIERKRTSLFMLKMTDTTKYQRYQPTDWLGMRTGYALKRYNAIVELVKQQDPKEDENTLYQTSSNTLLKASTQASTAREPVSTKTACSFLWIASCPWQRLKYEDPLLTAHVLCLTRDLYDLTCHVDHAMYIGCHTYHSRPRNQPGQARQS